MTDHQPTASPVPLGEFGLLPSSEAVPPKLSTSATPNPPPTTRQSIFVNPTDPQPQNAPASTNSADHSHSRSQAIEEVELLKRLAFVVDNSDSFPVLMGQLASIIRDSSDCLDLWGMEKNEHGDFSAPVSVLELEDSPLWSVVEDHALPLMHRCLDTRLTCSVPLPCNESQLLVASPIDEEKSLESGVVLLGCFSTVDQTALRIQWLMGFIANAVSDWKTRNKVRQQEVSVRGLKDAFAVIDGLNRTESVSAAGKIFVNHLQRMTQSDQVVLAIGPSAGKAKLESISGVEQLDHSSESAQAMLAACQQPYWNSSAIVYHRSMNVSTANELALKNYCESNQLQGCIALPITSGNGLELGAVATNGDVSESSADGSIRENNHLFATILIAASAERISDESFRSYVDQLVSMLGSHLELTIRANQSVRRLLADRMERIRKSATFRNLMIGCAIVTAVMLMPMPYRIACDCELEPTTRRFIAAPYEGILESSLVRSGDLVSESQILAHLDGRQLRMELAGLQAEFDGARKRRDASLAARDVAQSQIAKSEMRRHEASIKILETQLLNLEVRSPIDGVVVSGDLQKAQGAPVEMGQTLYEIAPLENMVAEIAIPESEIGYATEGMHVSVKLDAFPFQTFQGTIESIHPHAEAVNEAAVFVADVKIDNLSGQLRPGMKGQAKVASHWAPLGWNLFHRPWESIRYWTIW